MPVLRTRATHPPVRSLDVGNAPSTPSLKIVSPTPRTFTFPTSHNLADSPYSSPSNSPFESDLRRDGPSSFSSTPLSSNHVDSRTPPPLSTFTRTLFPVSAPTTPSPAPRRSPDSASSVHLATVEQRRPKRGDSDYVKRPENAFILFRRQCSQDLALSSSASAPSPTPSTSSSAPSPSSSAAAPPPKKQRQAELSKTISRRWKALSPEERAHWDDLAKEKKRQHELLHPNYVYRP
ncbi:hypothetical protein DFH06DRAFT_1048457, partial [Mycena polygramma]